MTTDSPSGGRRHPREKELDDAAPHILVIDDDRRLRGLLKQYLSEHGYRVTTAVDAADARKRMEGLTFDLLVLDVMMRGETGFELTRSLRTNSEVPILLLTAMGEAENRIEGLESGADDYLAKPFEPRELLLRIGTVLRRARHEDALAGEAPREVTFGRFRFDLVRGLLWRDSALVPLTSAETTLLKVLASPPGRALSRTRLSELCGGVKERSVDVMMTRLRRKIEGSARTPRYVRTERGKGYVLWAD